MKKYNFISGLPRAGSTLLSSILKQNPKFTTGISDPLHNYCHAIIRETNNSVGMDVSVSIEKRKTLMRDLFDSFYKNDKEVCFNTNRGWTANTSLLADLFPDFKMIVCLRDVEWIIDSFEQLNNKNPYTIKPLYHHQETQNVYHRSNILMGQVPGLPGFVESPLMCTKQSIFCAERNNICFVEYDSLVNDPYNVMKQIYQFLDEPWYEHDFDDVESSYDEFDAETKLDGLHKVKRKVQSYPRRPLLPGDLFVSLQQYNFWKHPDFDSIKQDLNWIKVGEKTHKPIIQPRYSRQL